MNDVGMRSGRGRSLGQRLLLVIISVGILTIGLLNAFGHVGGFRVAGIVLAVDGLVFVVMSVVGVLRSRPASLQSDER